MKRECKHLGCPDSHCLRGPRYVDGIELLRLARDASDVWAPKTTGFSPSQIKEVYEGFVSGFLRGFREAERRQNTPQASRVDDKT